MRFCWGPICWSPRALTLMSWMTTPSRCRQSDGTTIGPVQESMEVLGAKALITLQLHSLRYIFTALLKRSQSSFGPARLCPNSH